MLGGRDISVRAVAPEPRRLRKTGVDLNGPEKPGKNHGLPRPSAPSRRARRARMTRAHFLYLATGWAIALVAILAAAFWLRRYG
jgi:hypothetical protein